MFANIFRKSRWQSKTWLIIKIIINVISASENWTSSLDEGKIIFGKSALYGIGLAGQCRLRIKCRKIGIVVTEGLSKQNDGNADQSHFQLTVY